MLITKRSSSYYDLPKVHYYPFTKDRSFASGNTSITYKGYLIG